MAQKHGWEPQLSLEVPGYPSTPATPALCQPDDCSSNPCSVTVLKMQRRLSQKMGRQSWRPLSSIFSTSLPSLPAPPPPPTVMPSKDDPVVGPGNGPLRLLTRVSYSHVSLAGKGFLRKQKYLYKQFMLGIRLRRRITSKRNQYIDQ